MTPEYAREMVAVILGQSQLIRLYAMGHAPSIQTRREGTKVNFHFYLAFTALTYEYDSNVV